MKLTNIKLTYASVALAGASLLLGTTLTAVAEESAIGEIEEVIVLGRLRSSAEQLVDERMNEEVVMDVLGAEMIGRIGDSTVAAALRRVPGLSLVDDKFVYVRGLGERYSSTSLNGAVVPSPDLTRSVIPLDIFPTSIVESLSVQKTYSADMGANFGGGAVDIRTKGIPDDFTYSIEVGSSFNTESSGDMLSYNGGSTDARGEDDGTRALSHSIRAALGTYKGNFGAQNILSTIKKNDANATLADAERINRELATELYRDVSIDEQSVSPDIGIKGSVGNNFYVGDSWELGFLAGASYDNEWRNTEQNKRNFNFPEERIDNRRESKRNTEVMGNVSFGLRYLDDHEVTSTTLFLRNTDDRTAIRDYHNENREKSDGLGFREYSIKYEQRDMVVNQLHGSHIMGQDTKDFVPFLPLGFLPEETEITWFHSDSRASTKIPSQLDVSAQTVTHPSTVAVLSTAVKLGPTSANYRFTDLKDDVLSYGWQAEVPYSFERSELSVGFGYEYGRKVRTYKQRQFGVGADRVGDLSVLSGALGNVYSDNNILDTNNKFAISVTGTNNQSYIAATVLGAGFAKADWAFDETWRFAAGARWEDYKQIALDWNLNGFTVDNSQVTTDPTKLAQAVFTKDEFYPSASLTYMGEFWAEVFQLRLGWSETVVRPDLREITDASYNDPISNDLVDGNPNVKPSDISNFDVRGEWFFDSGDSFTVSVFYKDISAPIEFFESAASDTNIAREIVNAESAEVTGIEVEGYKNLAFLGDFASQFFLQGNFTMLDSELVAGTEADAPTNNVRQLTNASEYVVNAVLGFDSDDSLHSGTLAYNVFGERLYVAGRNGAPDGFQQPFHSLDMTYSFYPTDEMTLKLKLKNLLDESYQIEREGVVVLEETPGMTLSASFQYQF